MVGASLLSVIGAIVAVPLAAIVKIVVHEAALIWRGHQHTMLGLAIGIAASLSAAAANTETLPLVFPLTVQALAIGVTTTLMLPFLRHSQ